MIAIQNIHKSFDRKSVLQGASLTIETGASHIIIGRSGCGKSVLLKHIIGLLQPDQGQIVIDGKAIVGISKNELYAIRRRIGMLFQNAALLRPTSRWACENTGSTANRTSVKKSLKSSKWWDFPALSR